MNQLRVIQDIYLWLQVNPWGQSLSVKCDHVTQAKEELALFIGPKIRRQGRAGRIAQVDILVCNEETKTVDLIIEVDPNWTPKIPMGTLMSVLLADNYTPSHSYCPYKIENTLVVFLTLLDGRQGSQKILQFELVERTMQQKLALEKLGTRGVVLCHGATDDEAIRNCQKVIQTYFDYRKFTLRREELQRPSVPMR